jgi:hypothetical protein
MLYNAEDGGWVQPQCPFYAAVQCAIVDSDDFAHVHAISQNARIVPKVQLVHSKRRSETPMQ